MVFTDLDGALLDEEYDYQAVAPIISRLLSLNASIVLCSSKTRAEIEYYRQRMEIADPFIAENGAAIFIPKDYFPADYMRTRETARYHVIELDVRYSTVREKLARVRVRTGTDIIGFGDMTAEEVAKEAGLSLDLAKLAKKRAYDEPFRILKGNEGKVLGALKEEGLNCIKTYRYFHALGGGDKGKATTILRDLYSQTCGSIATFGVGDGPNDLPMLKAVDKPFLIRNTSRKNSNYSVWKKILSLVSKLADAGIKA